MKIKPSNTQKRLIDVMAVRNLKQKDILDAAKPFCRLYNVKLNKSDISQYIAGKSEPSQDKLYVLSKALRVNVVWLMGYDAPIEPLSANKKPHLIETEIQNKYGDLSLEALYKFAKLDTVDQGKILGRIELLLEGDKYSNKKGSLNA